MIVFKWFFVAALVTLSGCASVQPVPEKAGRAAPFDVLGRVLVHVDGRAVSANVRWMHAADADEIFLLTPTGQALAQLREDATGATLTSADKKQISGARAESLSKQALGWELPLARLQHWVRGTPMPNYAVEINERDAAGKIKRLTQDGWIVSYEYYAPTENDGLPRRMEISGEKQSIRLVIDTWRKEAP